MNGNKVSNICLWGNIQISFINESRVIKKYYLILNRFNKPINKTFDSGMF
jgi:hypothetical protein